MAPLWVPSGIKKLLGVGEKVVYGAHQSRLAPTLNPKKLIGKAIAPNSIWVTNKRVIVHNPSARSLGIAKDIQDYPYTEMVNIFQHKGFASSTIAVKMRFTNEPVVLDSVPKGDVDKVYRLIRNNLNQVQAGIFGTQPLSTARQHQHIPPPPPRAPDTCPSCNLAATWIQQYSRFYCYSCKRYLDFPPPPPPSIPATHTNMCTSCQRIIPRSDQFCRHCGHPV